MGLDQQKAEGWMDGRSEDRAPRVFAAAPIDSPAGGKAAPRVAWPGFFFCNPSSSARRRARQDLHRRILPHSGTPPPELAASTRPPNGARRRRCCRLFFASPSRPPPAPPRPPPRPHCRLPTTTTRCVRPLIRHHEKMGETVAYSVFHGPARAAAAVVALNNVGQQNRGTGRTAGGVEGSGGKKKPGTLPHGVEKNNL